MRQKKIVTDFLKIFFRFKPKKVKNYLSRTNKFNKNIYQKIEQQHILNKINKYKKKIILDYGCNDCFFSTKLNKTFRYTGVDNNRELLKKSTKLYSKNFIFLKNKKLPFANDCFDCVILSHVIAHIYKPKMLLDEIFRVLKKRGILIIISPNKIFKFFYFFLNLFNGYYPDETISKYYSNREIIKLIDNNLKIVESYSYSVKQNKIKNLFVNSRIVLIFKK